MNWDTIRTHWPQLTGMAKYRWGRLSGSDLRRVAGERHALAACIQERYSVSPEEALAQVQEWENSANNSWIY
ncbi:MAG: general stress protein CsbD [Hydrogenophaga sp.]|jgi:uncharacterized protein YjbJ (UPF0337 family)